MEMNRNRRQKWGSEAGVTLPETLAALVILAMVTVSVLVMVSYSMELNITGMDYATLTNRTRDKAEELLGTAWHDNPDGTVAMDPALAPGTQTEAQPDYNLTLTWQVTDRVINQSSPIPPGTETSLDPNVKTISVTAVSTAASGVGQRDVTVSVLKIKGAGQ